MNNKDLFQLNKKDRQIYKFANFTFFFFFTIFIIFMSFRIIFPSQFFTYSFTNINSLKNTITDMVEKDSQLAFFASTPLNFSQLKITLELSKSQMDLADKRINVRKAYKAFFYPEASPLSNLENKEENKLVSIDDSVFIIGNRKKTPIDSVLTFESLGYSWNNLLLNTADLSNYEKQKLADINAAHPAGTIFKTTDSSNYYFIEDFTKKKITNPPIENIKNPIMVDAKSLEQSEFCYLKKSKIFGKKYSCTIPLSDIINFIGKDYSLELINIPAGTTIKKIDLEFDKSITSDNFQFFLSELKKKILYRFGFKDE